MLRRNRASSWLSAATAICILLPVRAFALAALCVLGCSRPATTVLIEVQNGGQRDPAAVTVSVFDDFGLIGRSQITKASLPGAITVSGLPDVIQSLRVVALAHSP